MSKRLELAGVLQELSTALQSGTLAEAGETYRRAEALSIGMIPAKAEKSMLMQVVRKHLEKAFGGEMLRIITGAGSHELAVYDVTAELTDLIAELEHYDSL